MSDEFKVRMIPVCAGCEGGSKNGAGEECHTPGCSFWMRDAPLDPLQYHGVALDVDREALREALADCIGVWDLRFRRVLRGWVEELADICCGVLEEHGVLPREGE